VTDPAEPRQVTAVTATSLQADRPYLTKPGAGKLLPQLGLVKTDQRQTANALEVIEYTGPIQPPPHLHKTHDEAFYVLDGVFTFTLAGNSVEAGTGSFVYVPRGTVHGFTTSHDARALLITVPAGLEGFFDELCAGIEAGRTSADLRAALAGRYDSFPAEAGLP
jgi:mannose-6-phosphate isomerase-like protein (cupin superfamily)